MNPWEIFGWVAAIALSVIVVAITVTVVVALARPGKKESSTGIYRGRSDR